MDKFPQVILDERRWTSPLLQAFVVAGASGFATYLIAGEGIWRQWLYLLHAVVGILLVALFLPYVGVHFKRTRQLRRSASFILGLLSLLAVVALSGSGLHIILFGQRESLRWVYHLHIAMAFGGVSAVVIHLAQHRFSLHPSRLQGEGSTFPSVTPGFLRRGVFSVFFAGGTVFFAVFAYQKAPSSYLQGPAIQPYEYSYGEHPFRPSETETSTGGFVDAKRIAGSYKCGACHAQILEDWKASMHSQAASDKAYQRNINLLASKKGMATTRYCEGCHAPIALLSGQLTEGGAHGGIPETPAHIEGVSCLSCHGIEKVMHLRGVGSYQFTPQNDYLFAENDRLIPTIIHNFLVRIHPQEHRRDMARAPLVSPKLCGTCHAQFMDKDVNGWGWVKMQDDYTAWLNSPYSGQREQTFSHEKVTRCQDCHMPLVPAEDPSADANGMVRLHRMPGANTAIPFVTGDQEQLEVVRDFLRAGRVRIDIDEPSREDATHSGEFVERKALHETEAPSYFDLDETARLRVSVINALVGHNFPGGTIDINEAWVAFRVVDAQNQLVYESGHLLPNGDVDPNAHFYKSMPIDRSGKHVWRHDLFNMIGNSYEKVIPAGGADVVEYTFKIPFWAKSPLTASAVVRYRKLNLQYARWALEDETIQLPIVDMARAALTIPVRYKGEVER